MRFKGFINPWQTKRFEELYTKVIEKNGKTVTFDSNHVISVARMQWSPTVKQFDAEYAKTYNVFRVGDIAFEGNRSGGFAYGRFVANDLGNGIVSHVFDVFRPVNEAQQDAVYMRYFIHNENVMRDVLRKSTTRATMMNSLDTPSLNHQLLHVPGLEEQQKIASLLSSIDETLYLSRRKLDLLTQAKKALMQLIFSQQLRFKADDGSEFPAWEEKKLGDIGEVITGSTPSTKHKEYFGSEILWATPVDLNEQLVLKNTTRKLSRLGYSKGRKLPEGSVLVSCIATIGKVGVLPVPGSCNQQINAIIPETDVDSYWLGYAMRLKKPTLEMLGGNGGLKIVNKTLFENIHISIPSLPEQKKIAACLSSADALIAQARSELEQWQEVKKSLLQQLFV